MPTAAEMFAYFEKEGVHNTRLWLHGTKLSSVEWERAAQKWLAAKDQETDRLKVAAEVEQIEIARAASSAAERAAAAAERASTAAERQATAAERDDRAHHRGDIHYCDCR